MCGTRITHGNNREFDGDKGKSDTYGGRFVFKCNPPPPYPSFHWILLYIYITF